MFYPTQDGRFLHAFCSSLGSMGRAGPSSTSTSARLEPLNSWSYQINSRSNSTSRSSEKTTTTNKNVTPTSGVETPLLHIATDHKDTTEGAVHSFQGNPG